jgi:hypothetical protein
MEEQAASPRNPGFFEHRDVPPLFDNRLKLGSSVWSEADVGQASGGDLGGESLRQEPGERRMIGASVGSFGTIASIRAERSLEQPRRAMVALLLFIMHDVARNFPCPSHILLGKGAKKL